MENISNQGLDVPAAVRRLWPFLLGLLAIGFVVGLAASVLQPVSYTARAELVVVSNATDDARDAAVGEELAISRAQTYAILSNSTAIAAEVADKRGANESANDLLERVSVESAPDLPTIAITVKASSEAEARTLAKEWVVSLQASAARLDKAAGGKSKDSQTVQIVTVNEGQLPAKSSRIATPVMAAAGLGLGALLAASLVLYYGASRRRLGDLSSARQLLPTTAWIDLGAARYRRKRWEVTPGNDQLWDAGIAKLKGWLLDAPGSRGPKDNVLAVGTHEHSAATLVASSLGSTNFGVQGIPSADSPALFDTARSDMGAILVVDELSTAEGVRDAYLGIQAVGATVIGATFVHSGFTRSSGSHSAGAHQSASRRSGSNPSASG